ncbi:hypothetical protein Tsubulata_008389 [Turnera subulata]|uniref:Auxin efflux carrier component n=1 Tax=Turnera subulata TaxID=218843 RepID=A0A9Q0FEB9_9ROSI|nr:hypothetical protein Tsubulata_008389 [Turnera subulata]
MQFLDLFSVASMPVLKVLLVTALGTLLALDPVDILGESARKQLNRVVFFVFNPALVGGNLASTITSESIALLWFMPINILLTFIIGSALGWVLIKITRPPRRLQGLILGSCAAGNLGNLPLIIIPALCEEKGSPFGSADICTTDGIAYVSLSMAIGAVYLWSYVYNLVRICSSDEANKVDDNTVESDADQSTANVLADDETTPILIQADYNEALLPSKDDHDDDDDEPESLPPTKNSKVQKILDKIKQSVSFVSRNANLKALFSPSTIGAIVGFTIGVVPQIRSLMIGDTAPLRVIEGSTSFIG